MLNTWRCRLCLAICLAGSAAAFGSAYPEADRYFAVRNASHAVKANVTFAQVQANAVLWEDALIEVRGVIRGCARRDDGICLGIFTAKDTQAPDPAAVQRLLVEFRALRSETS